MFENNLHSRINHVLEVQKVKKAVLAKNIKQGESTMHNYLNGSTLPPSDFLEAVVGLTGANAHWLLTGEGEMLVGAETFTTPPVTVAAMSASPAHKTAPKYKNPLEYERDLAVMEVQLASARKEIELKDEIISLLKTK